MTGGKNHCGVVRFDEKATYGSMVLGDLAGPRQAWDPKSQAFHHLVWEHGLGLLGVTKNSKAQSMILNQLRKVPLWQGVNERDVSLAMTVRNCGGALPRPDNSELVARHCFGDNGLQNCIHTLKREEFADEDDVARYICISIAKESDQQLSGYGLQC